MGLLILSGFLSLLFQFGSLSLGIGYGTLLVPILILLGFPPLTVIPAVLFSQFLGGIVGGLLHHSFGNIRLDFRRERAVRKKLSSLGYIPRSEDSKVILLLSLLGCVGSLLGVLIALNIPEVALRIYIGALVLLVGFGIIFGRRWGFSWRRLFIFGFIASLNKGLSGGGYVPIITGGQIISGRGVKSSVGSTSIAVSVACLFGFMGYLFMGRDVNLWLLISTTTGSVLAAPLAALTTKKMEEKRLKFLIGAVMIVIGAITIIKAF